MADIRPFRGLRYDPAMVPDLGTAICPPYDVISPEMQQALHYKGPYNIVRVEYGLSGPEDSFWNNKYTRASKTFQEWMERHVLVRDKAPAVYLHHHYFNYYGEVVTRRGLIAAVRLEDWDKGVIRPHEGTAAVFKVDRLNLMRAVNANISPVFALYQDRGGAISSLMAQTECRPPLARVAVADDESHNLWAITEPQALETISSQLAPEHLYVADGHHRYETALAYRQERLQSEPDAPENAAFKFLMMTLVEFSDPGLIVQPFHRLIKTVPESFLRELKSKLDRYFEIDAAPLGCPLSSAMLHRILKPIKGERVLIGLLGLEQDTLLILRLRSIDVLASLLPVDRSEAYCSLDVSILHHVILSRLLGISEGENITYTKSELETWQRVSAQEYRLGFLLNPVDVYAVKAIADAGDKMPQKSTYFYPKLPTGLVINSLYGTL
ncbi:MAG: DUF1015 domain-containing protein [Chloroflexi bacterium]|nr:DUF1015 domain-containing protein [Chloroflexota bacterium]